VLFAKNGEASCTVTLLPYVSSFVTLSDTRLPISRLDRVSAVLTSIASAVQINVRRALCFPHVHNRYPWDDNTRLHASVFFLYLHISRTNHGWYGRNLEREDRIGNVAWEDSGFERMLFSDGMGGMEVVLSEPECQSSPPGALGVDGSGKEKARDRRALRQGVVEPAIETW